MGYTEEEAAELFKRTGAIAKALPREPRECGREGCDVVFTPTGPRGKYCDECKAAVKAEQNKSYKERDKWCRICGNPVGKFKQYICDDEACTRAYKNLQERDARRAKRNLPSVAECPDLGDPFPGEANTCPDCGAAYDPTATASRGSNKRQFTRREHGIDMDYFICFCGHKWTRYK